ncbi:MAG: hypothetical protein ACRDO2_01515 [Nocardioidaceae bacterium]
MGHADAASPAVASGFLGTTLVVVLILEGGLDSIVALSDVTAIVAR